VLWRQHLYRHGQVVHVILNGQVVGGDVHWYSLALWLPAAAFDPLVHRVQNASGEVRPGVGQSLRIVGSRGLAQGEVSLPLQVVAERRSLPAWAMLQKVTG